ncbi:hypothetical protein ACH5RR_005059 [Cinchona calisaya]|uniref:Uncharacterized protein n=1 Tax=Cinchona calisaya TaxID=153742 RepID=A0ABD3AZZ2_9GENT
MLISNGPDSFHKKSFRVKHDDKFFSRLVSRESSMANPSFRVYYGDASAGAVPFTWETRPGTPKYTFSDSTVPPLTPPPSYYSRTTVKPVKKQPRSRLFRSLLMKINLSKPHLTTSPSSSSSLSSLSLSSSYSSSFSNFRGRRRLSSWGSSLDEREELDYHLRISNVSAPKSKFCFPVTSDGNEGGNNSVFTMKKNLLSIIGCGSG